MAAMESHVTNYLKLDQEFDKCLAEMKPHVLKLPHKTGELIVVSYFTSLPLRPFVKDPYSKMHYCKSSKLSDNTLKFKQICRTVEKF